MERGEDRERAEFAARRELGNQGLIKETTRGMWGWALRDQLAQDVRYAARTMRKNPGFAAVVVSTLALGIGANTAIYSVIRAALEPIAIPSADRAVMVWTENPRREWQQFPSSYADYLDWKAGGAFETLAAFSEAGVNLRLADRTERVEGLDVSANFFEVFSLPPQLGRTIQPQDEQPGRPRVAVISDELWHSRFGGNPGIAGTGAVIDGVPYTIAGVLPGNFPTISHEKIYRPLSVDAGMAADRGHRFLYVAGRLRSGINLPAAQQAMEALNVQLEARYPASNTGNRVRLQPLAEAYVQDAQTLSLVLAGAVGFVLLIACANIANLLLARGTARGKEMTIRAALGAGRGKLARQLLTESVCLALTGGFLAILPALWGIRLATSLHIDELPNTDQVALDWKVLAFTLALSLLTGIVCGLAPAWQVAKVHVSDALKAAGGRPEGRFHQRMRGMFVVSEIALTLVLLAGAGLLLRSFIQLRTSNPGYDPKGVLTLRVALSERQYADPARQAAFFDAAIQRLRALPGVVDAAGTRELPTSDDIHGTGLHFADRPEPRADEIPLVLLDTVTPEYFRAMRVPLLRGRYLNDLDRRGAPLTAVVDEWTARRSWPGQDAIGRQIRFGSGEPLARSWAWWGMWKPVW